MASVPSVALRRGSQSFATGRALPWVAAIALHVLLLLAAGYMIAPPHDYSRPEPQDERTFAVVRLPPPPPRLEGALAETAASIMPRFRPRYHLPQGVPLITTTQRGSAAEALFRYWCSNRPDTMEATGRLCPPGTPFNGLAALPTRSPLNDPTLAETAADRGWSRTPPTSSWMKIRPPTAEEAQRAKTDKTVGAKSDEVYGGFPWEATPSGR